MTNLITLIIWLLSILFISSIAYLVRVIKSDKEMDNKIDKIMRGE